jgi:hypothetical protein
MGKWRSQVGHSNFTFAQPGAFVSIFFLAKLLLATFSSIRKVIKPAQLIIFSERKEPSSSESPENQQSVRRNARRDHPCVDGLIGHL